MRPSGKVNLIGILLLLAISAGLYWVIFFAPKYLDNMDVKTAVDSAFEASGRITDVGVARQIIQRANSPEIGNHLEEDAEGNEVERRGLGFTEDNVVVERNESENIMTITVDYQRRVKLLPTDKVKWLKFHVEKTGTIPK